MLVFERAQRTQRAHLRHAPGVQDRHAKFILEGMDHGGWACRTTNHRAVEGAEPETTCLDVVQQHLPDRGHTCGKGHPFRFDQLIHRLAIQGRPRKHQLAAGERCRIGNAPGIDVKHGHHRQHGIARRQVHHIGQRCGIGVQRGRAVAVERRLGVAGGPAGVAHAGCRVFVKHGPGVVGGCAANPCLVAHQTRDSRVGWQLVGIAQRHPFFHRGAACVHRLHQRQEGDVKAHHLVFGMVDDPGDLIRMQSRVDGVQHTA